MKIKIWLNIVLFGLLLALLSMSYWSYQTYLTQQNQLASSLHTKLLASQLSDYVSAESLNKPLELPALESSLSSFKLLDSDENVVISDKFLQQESAAPSFFAALLQPSPLTNSYVFRDGDRKISTLHTLYYPRESIDILWYVSLAALAVFVIVLLICNLFIVASTKPQKLMIDELKLAINKVINGQYTPMESSIDNDRYSSLKTDFNTMVYQIESTNVKLKKYNNQLQNQVNYDPLTGLANRALFNEKLNQLLQSDGAANGGFLLLLQLSSLTEINLKFGHIEGDVYIGRVAKKLTEIVAWTGKRSEVFRSNGSELLAIIGDVNQLQIETLANDLSRALVGMDDHHHPDGVGYFSITEFEVGESYADLMARLDAGLSQALNRGTNRYVITDNASGNSVNYSNWPVIISNILTGNCLSLMKSPLSQTNDSALYQHEITCAFDIRDKKYCDKEVFASAQRLGMAMAIDQLVVAEIFKQYSTHFRDNVRVATHISIQSLHSQTFLLWLNDLFEKNPKVAKNMVFQFSEHGAMGNIGRSARFIDLVQKFGGMVCIEYFGDSLSSFQLLRHLNVDMLKLDNRYTKEVDQNRERASLIRTLIIMAHGASIPIIAAEVDTDEEWHMLNELGIDGIQGGVLQQPEAFFTSSI